MFEIIWVLQEYFFNNSQLSNKWGLAGVLTERNNLFDTFIILHYFHCISAWYHLKYYEQNYWNNFLNRITAKFYY